MIETDSRPTNNEIKEQVSGDQAFLPTIQKGRCYNLGHKNRGKAIIFDHYKFDGDNRPVREPFGVDAERLKNVLVKYGFNVEIYVDRRRAEITKILKEVASEDHSDNDCILVTVMTHGSKKELCAFDFEYKVEELWIPFSRSKTLVGKPKIFLVQACRGEDQDLGHDIKVDSDSKAFQTKIPAMADILVAYSSFHGFEAYRHRQAGSWFIQLVCDELDENKDDSLDFVQSLTMANNRLALYYEAQVEDKRNNEIKAKQVACIMSSLTRLLYLNKINS